MKSLEWLKEEIEKLDTEESQRYPHWKAVWRNEVLDLINQVEQPDYNGIFDRGYKDGYKTAKNQMPEQPALPVVPGFVAEYIEWQKSINEFSFTGILGDVERERPKIGDWLYDNQEGFFRAWFDGHTVEKKKYEVRLPSGEGYDSDYALMDVHGRIWNDAYPSEYQLTEDEIKKIDPRYMAFAKEVTNENN